MFRIKRELFCTSESTSKLEQRAYQHKNKLVDGLSKKYNCIDLIFYEDTTDVHAAIAREKEIKGWKRQKKDALIQIFNPSLKTLNLEL